MDALGTAVGKGPVAFQGERGAYSEAAASARFGAGVECLPCETFAQLFAAVAEGRALAGVVPIENSLAGSVLENYDLLQSHDLPIVGEIRLAVRHCLLAPAGTRLADVKRAYSHPQALAQSLPFLQSHGIEPVAAYDTAGAAKALAASHEVGAAAIAGARAGEIYGLETLASDIQANDDNTTRFFVIARWRPSGLEGGKATLVFGAPNAPGSLYRCLGHFAAQGYDLTKIESRPTRGTAWEYHFHVDLVGDLAPTRLEELCAALATTAAHVRVLGVYPPAAVHKI